jgi:hypothetical protein
LLFIKGAYGREYGGPVREIRKKGRIWPFNSFSAGPPVTSTPAPAAMSIGRRWCEIEDTPPEAALSNEQIEEYYAFLSERMAAKAKPAEPSITIAPGPQTVN